MFNTRHMMYRFIHKVMCFNDHVVLFLRHILEVHIHLLTVIKLNEASKTRLVFQIKSLMSKNPHEQALLLYASAQKVELLDWQLQVRMGVRQMLWVT